MPALFIFAPGTVTGILIGLVLATIIHAVVVIVFGRRGEGRVEGAAS